MTIRKFNEHWAIAILSLTRSFCSAARYTEYLERPQVQIFVSTTKKQFFKAIFGTAFFNNICSIVLTEIFVAQNYL